MSIPYVVLDVPHLRPHKARQYCQDYLLSDGLDIFLSTVFYGCQGRPRHQHAQEQRARPCFFIPHSLIYEVVC